MMTGLNAAILYAQAHRGDPDWMEDIDGTILELLQEKKIQYNVLEDLLLGIKGSNSDFTSKSTKRIQSPTRTNNLIRLT